MKRYALALVLVVTASPASAAPTLARAPVRTPASLSGRLGRTITKNGINKTAKEALDTEFDGTETVTLPNGTKLGIQDVLDRIGDAEAKAQTQGTSMTTLPKKTSFKATTASKLGGQKLEPIPSPSGNGRPPSAGANCTPESCIPYETEKTATWSTTKGDEDVVAAYSSFTVKSQMPDAYNAGCTATWDNGVYLIGGKYSVLKFTASVTSKKKPQTTWSGAAGLYVLGQASPVWHKETSVNLEPLDRSFKTPEARLMYTLIPGIITASGSVQATATLSFKPLMSGGATASAVTCNLGLEPRLVASVTGGVQLTVGVDRIAELASGGLKGEIRAADIGVPTTLKLAVSEAPLGAALDFQSDLDAKLAAGRLYLWYKLADICNKKGTICLVEDILGINTSGETDLLDWDGFVFSKNLTTFHGSLGWKKK